MVIDSVIAAAITTRVSSAAKPESSVNVNAVPT